MRIVTKRALLLCVLPLLLASTRTHAQPAANAQTQAKIHSIPFQTLAAATTSGCARPARLLISDEKEWQRVWGIHLQGVRAKQNASLPDIDWARQVIVALLMGEVTGAATQTTSIAISQIVHTPLDTVVFYRETRPKQEATANSTRVQPVHFALLDRPATPVRFVNLSVPDCATCVLGAKP